MCEAKEGDGVWLSNEHGVTVVTITTVLLPDALQLMRDAFYTDESAALGVQLQKYPNAIDELEQLTLETYKDGVSLVALKNGKVVGASFNKVQRKSAPEEKGFFERFRDEKCKTDVAKEYVDCMIRVDQKNDVYEHYGVSSGLEVMFLVTARGLRGQGVGRLLVDASAQVARYHNLPLCSAIFTSNASQQIGEQLGWDRLATMSMDEFVFRGVPYSVYTKQDKTQALMALRLL